jgi:hypothetical protein
MARNSPGRVTHVTDRHTSFVLREQGIKDPYELLEVNAFYVIVASMCRDVDHD